MGTRYRGATGERRVLDTYVKLLRCTSVLEARLARELAVVGMTIPQLAVLEALLHLGPLCQRELGEKMLRSGGSVTTLVDHLERKGWVRRERRADDRRVVDVHLAPAGRRLIEEVFPEHVEHLREAFGALTAGEQAELGRLCRKLGRALAGLGEG